jgi:hypothetical protein
MPDNVIPVTVSIVKGQPVCSPEQVDVDYANTLITFALTSDDYHFPDTGAVVVTDGGGDFPCPSWTLKKRQAALLDLNVLNGNFSYTVTVVHNESGLVLTVDPTIRNSG